MEKHKILTYTSLFLTLLVLTSVWYFQTVYARKNEVKNEEIKILSPQEIEDSYFLKIKDENKRLISSIPNLEKRLEIDKLKQDCLVKQIELIVQGKKYVLDYCNDLENLKKKILVE